MCLHGALCSIKLIGDTTTFRKKNVFTLTPTPGVEAVCQDSICAFTVLYAPFSSNLICDCYDTEWLE